MKYDLINNTLCYTIKIDNQETGRKYDWAKLNWKKDKSTKTRCLHFLFVNGFKILYISNTIWVILAIAYKSNIEIEHKYFYFEEMHDLAVLYKGKTFFTYITFVLK